MPKGQQPRLAKRPWEKPATFFLIAVVYYAMARLGLGLKPVNGFATLAWAPTGIGLAMALRLGPGVGLVIWGAAALANFHVGASPLVALLIGVGNALESLVGAHLLKKANGGRVSLVDLRQVLLFIGLGAVASTTIAASVGTVALSASAMLDPGTLLVTWLTWWLGDAIGALIVAPPLLLWPQALPQRPAWPRLCEALALGVSAVVISAAIFFGWGALHPVLAPFLFPHSIYPLIIWAALRFSTFATSLVGFGVVSLAALSAWDGLAAWHPAGHSLNLLFTQTFAAVAAVTGLLLATVTSQFRRAKVVLDDEGERLKAIFSQSQVGIAQIDRTGRYLFANELYCQLVGRSHAELLSVGLLDVLHPDEVASQAGPLLRSMWDTNHRPVVEESRYQRPDGMLVWVSTCISPLREAQGRTVGALVVIFDINKRKKAEAALRASQQFSRGIVESCADCIKVLDDTGHLISINGHGLKLLGVDDPMQVIGRPWYEFWQGEAKQAAERIVSSALNGRTDRFQGSCPTAVGNEKWWDVIASPLPAEEGTKNQVLVISRDITELRSASDALLASEARFRLLSEALPQIVWTAEPDGVPNYLNTYWTHYTGLPDGRGSHWDEAMHPDDRAAAHARWHEGIGLGQAFENEFRLRRHEDGQFRWFVARISPLRDRDGRMSLWVGMATDMHDRKTNQEELQRAKAAAEAASRSKSMFLANMSHEIRTPLGAILGFAELLKDTSLSDKDKNEFIAVINRNGKELVRLIDDILDLSRVEAGRLAIELKTVPLQDLLADVVAVQSIKAREQGLSFALSFEGLLPAAITTDPTRLRQILSNIIGNAIKFTQKGRVEVKVSLREFAHTEGAEGRLAFLVSDTGRGFSQEHRALLFQPFAQGDGSVTRRYGGTGLGLALSRHLAHSLQGEVEVVESRPGVGSTFLITVGVGKLATLSLIDPRLYAAEAGASAPLPMEGQQPLAGMTVLLAEDLRDNQVLIQRVLRSAGARVELAVNGAEALAMAQSQEFDAVVMDIQMPVMDGLTATIKLRSQGYEQPIIALTAHAMKEERDRCLKAGCTDHIAKPVNQQVLLAALSQVRVARGTRS